MVQYMFILSHLYFITFFFFTNFVFDLSSVWLIYFRCAMLFLTITMNFLISHS